MKGWIAVDFDGTLAIYDKWVSAEHCGEPIAPMVERVKRWLAKGHEVRVFTARCWPLVKPITPDFDLSGLVAIARSNAPLSVAEEFARAATAITSIRAWCKEHIGQELTVTCVKDYGMHELWDDRAVAVEANTGRALTPSRRGLD